MVPECYPDELENLDNTVWDESVFSMIEWAFAAAIHNEVGCDGAPKIVHA